MEISNILKLLVLKPAEDRFMQQLTTARKLHALVSDCPQTQQLVKATMIEIVEHAHDGHDDESTD
jgi:hypothetical protein|tara:strand:+ start:906 stop:1100 length:195 start_codon:yes stop_codon:yes gene_type:complete